MKKANFIKAIEKYHSKVAAGLPKSGIDPDTAQDAVQEMFAALIANKAYNNLEYEAIDWRILSYFKSSARSHVKDIMVKQVRDNDIFVSIESESEKERDEKADVRDRVKDPKACPYCFADITINPALDRLELSLRTHNNACETCGTIVGRGKSVREHISIDEADLASFPDLDMSIDVANAVAALEPLEQKVVRAIANNTDTLDGLADMYGMSRDTLWRTYVRAKKKLQISLLEYAS